MENILKDSKNWICKNNIFKDMNRWEGELEHQKFNHLILEKCIQYKNNYNEHTQSYLIGLELEFYINKNKVNKLLEGFVLGIPKEKMIIENINEVLTSDGKQFFLIQDRTGIPPNGYISLELITPILDIKMIPYYVNLFFNILNKYGAVSDENIGLHIHVSTKNCNKISPISLLYFLYKNNVFRWKNRKFVRNTIEQIFDYKSNDWKFIYEEVIRKCYSINFSYFHDNNRIEYRAPGGIDYLNKEKKILSSFFSIIKSFEDTLSTSDKDTSILINNTFDGSNKIINISELSLEKLKNNKNDLWNI